MCAPGMECARQEVLCAHPEVECARSEVDFDKSPRSWRFASETHVVDGSSATRRPVAAASSGSQPTRPPVQRSTALPQRYNTLTRPSDLQEEQRPTAATESATVAAAAAAATAAETAAVTVAEEATVAADTAAAFVRTCRSRVVARPLFRRSDPQTSRTARNGILSFTDTRVRTAYHRSYVDLETAGRSELEPNWVRGQRDDRMPTGIVSER